MIGLREFLGYLKTFGLESKRVYELFQGVSAVQLQFRTEEAVHIKGKMSQNNQELSAITWNSTLKSLNGNDGTDKCEPSQKGNKGSLFYDVSSV